MTDIVVVAGGMNIGHMGLGICIDVPSVVDDNDLDLEIGIPVDTLDRGIADWDSIFSLFHDHSLLLLSTWFLGQDQHLWMSRTLHWPAPDPLLRPIDGHYGQEGWYPRRDPTTRLAALGAERIPDRKSTSRCVMTTLHLGRDDRGKENAVSPP